MSMTEREKAARAIGYLEGISAVLWSLDSDKVPVPFCAESAAYYDECVETLRKAIFDSDRLKPSDVSVEKAAGE